MSKPPEANATDPLPQHAPEVSLGNPFAGGDTEALYRAAIGAGDQDYYLRHFLRFDANGKAGASWHWVAYWATLNWLIFRRMWGWALAYGAVLATVTILVFGLGKLLLNYPDNTGLVLFLAFLSLAFVLPGLYANAIYYTFCNRNISAALQTTPDIPSACKALAEQAPTPKRWLKIAMVNVVLLALLAGVANFFLNPPSGLAVLTEAQKSRPSVGVVTDAPPAAPAPEPAPATPTAIPPTTPAPTPPVTPPATAPTSTPTTTPTTAPITPPATTSPATTPPTSSAPAAATETKPASEPQKPASNAKVPVVRPARQEPVTPAQPTASAALSPWYVQAGAYSREDSAQTVRTRLELAGLTASTEAIDTPAGRLIRVRAGPFSNKAQADQAVVKIKALELPAVLFRD
jgi:cell division protein FtsN